MFLLYKVTTDEIVTSLKIYKNVAVVPTNDESNEIQIVGDKVNVDNILIKVSNGELTITGYTDGLVKENVVVYVPANTLAGVYIRGGSTIRSSGMINNDLLDVTVNGEAISTIQSAGRINLNTIGDLPFEAF